MNPPADSPPASLRLILHRGHHDELILAIDLAAVTAVAGGKVRILFSGWMLERLGRKRLAEVHLAVEHAGEIEDYARRMGLKDPTLDPELPDTILNLKNLGDVRFFACSAACARYGFRIEDLQPWVDEILGVAHFLLEEGDGGPLLFF